MNPARQQLLSILREARALLALPGNDFSWSSWEDGTDAVRELDSLISTIEVGQLPNRLTLSVIFAPTGPMQETSLSSGWANEFLALANRSDGVIAEVYR